MATTVQHSTRAGRSSVPGSRRRRLPRLVKALALLVALVLGVVLFLAGNVVSSARSYDTTPSDAIVVLGAAQYWGDPSPVLANRLDHAADLYRMDVAPTIITVGGGIPGDKITEAQAGADFLKSKGIPESAIVAISQGTDTIESLEAVAERAGDNSWGRLAIVSDRAHVARSAAIAEALGFETSVSGPASGDGSLLSFERVGWEALGIARFYLWDRWLMESR